MLQKMAQKQIQSSIFATQPLMSTLYMLIFRFETKYVAANPNRTQYRSTASNHITAEEIL